MSKYTDREREIINTLEQQRYRGAREVYRQNAPEKKIYKSVPRRDREGFRQGRQDKVDRSVTAGMMTFDNHKANALRQLEADLAERGVAPENSAAHRRISRMTANYTIPESRAAPLRRTIVKPKPGRED